MFEDLDLKIGEETTQKIESRTGMCGCHTQSCYTGTSLTCCC